MTAALIVILRERLGLTYSEIVRRLYVDFGITMTRQTACGMYWYRKRKAQK